MASALLSGCSTARAPADWVSVLEVTPPFLQNQPALHPAVAADAHGRVALTWVTRDSTGMDLWLAVSRDTGLSFAPPIRVNVEPGRVSSFPENRPLALYGSDGRLAIVWCQSRDGEHMAADIVVRASGDGGATFGPPVAVNDDAAGPHPVYHGFPALAFLPEGALFAVWMDERESRRAKHADEEPSSAPLFYAVSEDGGQSWSDNALLTDRACPCCRAAAMADADGRIAVAYRAAGENLRDPALVISLDGGRSFGLDTVFSADRWQLDACPGVGSAITWNRGAGGQYAWYTEAGERGVYVAPWKTTSGLAGVKRSLMDSLADASHPRAVALGASTLIAVEARPRADSTHSVIAVRALDADGAATPWTFLGANASAGWIAALGDRAALACWSEKRDGQPRVRITRLVRRAPGS